MNPDYGLRVDQNHVQLPMRLRPRLTALPPDRKGKNRCLRRKKSGGWLNPDLPNED
jgi:hypothetical protein